MCNSKTNGGTRCAAEYHPRAGSHLVASEVVRNSSLDHEQGLRLITRVKRLEAALLGVTPVRHTASHEAVKNFIEQEKEQTMKNESLNEGHRYRIASRWEYVAQGRIPTALLAAWKRVLSWARSGAFRTVGAGVLVATLAACSSGGAQEPLTAPPAQIGRAHV